MQDEWTRLLAPIVRKFEVAAAFGQNAAWNAEGSKAMATLLSGMAQKLDRAVALHGDAIRPDDNDTSPRPRDFEEGLMK